jgi:hypothetical protein
MLSSSQVYTCIPLHNTQWSVSSSWSEAFHMWRIIPLIFMKCRLKILYSAFCLFIIGFSLLQQPHPYNFHIVLMPYRFLVLKYNWRQFTPSMTFRALNSVCINSSIIQERSFYEAHKVHSANPNKLGCSGWKIWWHLYPQEVSNLPYLSMFVVLYMTTNNNKKKCLFDYLWCRQWII